MRLRRLPRYLAFQLKRFVFDFETFERRKCADAFQFPNEARLGHLVEAPAGDVAGGRGAGDDRPGRTGTKSGARGAYALQSILLHRGQNATSGHYVALVRADGAPGDGGASAEPSAFTHKKTESVTEAASDAWWRFDDEEVTALRGGPFGEPVVKSKDGWTLGPGSYASSDAYLLVYKRVDDDEDARAEGLDAGPGGRAAAAGQPPALPPDLAAAVARENAALAAMVATFASRVEEARARVETRKAHARRVAEIARPPRVRLGDDEEPTNAEHLATDRNQNDADERGDVLASESPDAYRFVPRAWLERFCDDTHDPGPMDLRPILCAHGAVDPNKTEAVVRVSTEAFECLVAAAAAAESAAPANAQIVGASAPRVCRRCLRASAALFAGEDAEVTARAEARARLEAWERQARASAKHQASGPEISSIPDALDDPADVSDAPFLVSAAWLEKWRAWRRGPPPNALTKEGPTFSVTCVHGALKPNANVTRVDRETWSFLVQNPPAAPRKRRRRRRRDRARRRRRDSRRGRGPRGRSRRGGGGRRGRGRGRGRRRPARVRHSICVERGNAGR